MDDVGFGASSAFGGPCETPNAERLAAGGLKYNRFHTTALCAPTRQAMLTGRNHHSVGMGSITETATSAPGNSSLRPNTKAPLAMTLKLNGYSTAQFGKCHEVPVWQSSPMGPFDAWPSGGGGFETFYGFIGGENNQYEPALYDGTTPVEPPTTPEEGYHLTEDLADRAVSWIRTQKALMPEKPFFVYFAPGATHAPHHVPKEWADKYKGKFADGWDAQRERTFARQKELGVIPADTELTARHEVIPAWDDMPDELKPVLERQMEVYAGFLEHTDFHVGTGDRRDRRPRRPREHADLLHHRRQRCLGGGHAERCLQRDGELQRHGRALETPEFLASKIDELGSPSSYNHYAVGWAWAMNAPFQWTKQVASHWGGTRNGTIVHWPNGIAGEGRAAHPVHALHRRRPHDPRGGRSAAADRGQRRAAVADRRHQHAVHLRRARRGGAPRPAVLRDVRQPGRLLPGHERGDQAPHAVAAGRRRRCPRSTTTCGSSTTDATDYSQAHDLAAEHPDKLHELQRLWLIEAVKYNVLPIDDRTGERLNPELAGRPTLIHGDSQLLFGGMGRLSESSVVSIKNKSFSVTAEIEVPAQGRGGRGHRPGRPVRRLERLLHRRQGATSSTTCSASTPSPPSPTPCIEPGKHQVRMEFAYDGGGLAKGGDVTLYYDGTAVGTGRVGATQPMIFSADETTDVGYESGTSVSPDYTAQTSRFTGKIHWVQIDTGEDDHDHLIDPDERLRIAMARQ